MALSKQQKNDLLVLAIRLAGSIAVAVAVSQVRKKLDLK